MIKKALVGFAGFGGPEIALRELGYQVTGIELDDSIAAINRLNGGNCLTANILDIDPADYAGWTLYHFSPPCPSFSIANPVSSETKTDMALAQKIADFISVGRPGFLTLENVWLYRKSKSWKLILTALRRNGYGVDWWHLNTADYGVPQSRKRMVVIARRDGQKPVKPWATHRKTPDMFTQPWRGWYGAVEDLIPELPESQFADWQLDRMPAILKPFLVGHSSVDIGLAEISDPAFTITVSSTRLRAFIVNSQNTTRLRAFIVNSQNTTRQLTIRQHSEPALTVTASDGRRPTSTPKAFSSGKVVSMTPRVLARFQDFPDWFQLPDNRALACRGIGNALPPGLYRAVLKSLGAI